MVLAPGGGGSQGWSDVDVGAGRAGRGPGRAEQVFAQLALLLMRHAGQGGVGGPALDDGQRLEDTVVEGAGHLLPGPGGGDLLLRPAQEAGQVAGGGPAEGVEDHRVGEGEDLAAGIDGGAVDDNRRHPAQADGDARQGRAHRSQGHAGAEDAGEGPHRTEGLRRGEGVVGAVHEPVADHEGGGDREFDQDGPRPAQAGHVGAEQDRVGDGDGQGQADQEQGHERPVELLPGHEQHRRHPQPRAPPKGRQPLENRALHTRSRVRRSGSNRSPVARRR